MNNRKELKSYYQKKEFCYNIYDLSNFELCIGCFDSLNDLYNFLKDNNYTTEKTKISSVESLKSMISQHKLINDRLEIIKVCLD